MGAITNDWCLNLCSSSVNYKMTKVVVVFFVCLYCYNYNLFKILKCITVWVHCQIIQEGSLKDRSTQPRPRRIMSQSGGTISCRSDLVADRERSGSVVECLTRDRRAAGSSLTGVTVLCPWARHINPSLVLVQPRKTRPFITERLLMGRNESNQTKQKTS